MGRHKKSKKKSNGAPATATNNSSPQKQHQLSRNQEGMEASTTEPLAPQPTGKERGTVAAVNNTTSNGLKSSQAQNRSTANSSENGGTAGLLKERGEGEKKGEKIVSAASVFSPLLQPNHPTVGGVEQQVPPKQPAVLPNVQKQTTKKVVLAAEAAQASSTTGMEPSLAATQASSNQQQPSATEIAAALALTHTPFQHLVIAKVEELMKQKQQQQAKQQSPASQQKRQEEQSKKLSQATLRQLVAMSAATTTNASTANNQELSAAGSATRNIFKRPKRGAGVTKRQLDEVATRHSSRKQPPPPLGVLARLLSGGGAATATEQQQQSLLHSTPKGRPNSAMIPTSSSASEKLSQKCDAMDAAVNPNGTSEYESEGFHGKAKQTRLGLRSAAASIQKGGGIHMGKQPPHELKRIGQRSQQRQIVMPAVTTTNAAQNELVDEMRALLKSSSGGGGAATSDMSKSPKSIQGLQQEEGARKKEKHQLQRQEVPPSVLGHGETGGGAVNDDSAARVVDMEVEEEDRNQGATANEESQEIGSEENKKQMSGKKTKGRKEGKLSHRKAAIKTSGTNAKLTASGGGVVKKQVTFDLPPTPKTLPASKITEAVGGGGGQHTNGGNDGGSKNNSSSSSRSGKKAASSSSVEMSPMGGAEEQEPLLWQSFTPRTARALGVDESCVVLERNVGTAKATTSNSSNNPPFRLFQFSYKDVGGGKTELEHSLQVGLRALQWLTSMDPQHFFNAYFQQKALVVKRADSTYFDGLFSTRDLTRMLVEHHLHYTTNVNVASYVDGQRQTWNSSSEDGEEEGNGSSNNASTSRVTPMAVQRHLAKERSVQWVNPQSFNDHVWYLCEVLQEVFGCFVGANSYLTPAESSGFAPHWDDIDAFLVQLEGRKHWRVYAPSDESAALPLESSGNLTVEEMRGRRACFEGWLEAGDTLYLPRGFIHQASTVGSGGVHSLHLTVSLCRAENFTFAHLLRTGLDRLVEAWEAGVKGVRASLPFTLLDMGGIAAVDYHSGGDEWEGEEEEAPVERRLWEPIREVLEGVAEDFKSGLPSLIDAIGREFMRTALPPLLTPEERAHSCHSLASPTSSYSMLSPPSSSTFGYNAKTTRVRLIRRHAQRLLFESEQRAFLAHRMWNSRCYEGRPEVLVDPFPLEWESAFALLVNAYPEWVEAKQLRGALGGKSAEQEHFVRLMFENGLVMLRNGEEGGTA